MYAVCVFTHVFVFVFVYAMHVCLCLVHFLMILSRHGSEIQGCASIGARINQRKILPHINPYRPTHLNSKISILCELLMFKVQS